MKRIVQMRSFVIVACLSGCSSTQSYFTDRGRDALDVVTATVGTGAGIQARIGPLPFAWMRATDISGIRYGDLFYRVPEEEDEPEELNGKLGTMFYYASSPVAAMVGVNPFDLFEFADDMWYSQNHFPMNEVQLSRNKSTENLELPNYTQLEAFVGLGFSLRLGFNPGEFVDLLLGLTTIDIFNDDIEWDAKRSDQKFDPTVKTPISAGSVTMNEWPDLENPDMLSRVEEEALLSDMLDLRDEGDEALYYKLGSAVPFTGWLKKVYPNGQLEGVAYVKDGKADGPYTMWHENGQKAQESTARNGLLEGPFTLWHENGQKAEEGTFKDGKLEGLVVFWDESGVELKRLQYKGGTQVFQQEMMDPNQPHSLPAR